MRIGKKFPTASTKKMTAFIIIFTIFGLIIGIFGGLACGWKGFLVGILCAGLLAVAMAADESYKAKEWNGGICTECGGEYKFSGASKSRNGIETLYYTCEDCDHLIRQ